MRGQCERCHEWRSRLYRCATCGKHLCGCCSHKTLWGGRVCGNPETGCLRAYLDSTNTAVSIGPAAGR